jgi:Tfp pilus assembly protein PilX
MSRMLKRQQGSTLVMVLIIVLLVMIIGAVVIKQGLVSLNIATNNQAQNLMTQNSDAAIFNVEDASQLAKELAGDGMFGYIRTEYNKGKELVFCYRGGDSNFFSLANASIMQWKDGQSQPDGTELGTDGYCALPTSSNYTSSRNAVMTQVSVQFVELSTDSTPFSGSVIGTDSESSKTMSTEKAIVHATSLMPTLSTASDSEINACLSTKMNNPVAPTGVSIAANADQSVSTCLASLHVPFTTHIAEYNLTQTLSGES